ncbi:MAG: hypothetical protein Q8M18_17860 [Bradyrhizobium sp.]|nr:hypothetical protein [Bradyrhizobium sp.]
MVKSAENRPRCKLAAYLEGRLKHGLLLALEVQIVSGDGTAGKMKELTFAGNFTAFVAGPAGESSIDGVQRAIGQLNDNSYAADVVILNPSNRFPQDNDAPEILPSSRR